MKKILHKVFGFKHIGYVAVKHIYYDGIEPCIGYGLYYKYKLLWLDCYDRVAICHNKEYLEKELSIREINLLNQNKDENN